MEFFKHFTDGHESSSMTKLMNEFGLEGYGAYFLLMEICIKKMKKNGRKSFTETDCKFRFSERTVREKLRMRATKVRLFLNLCSTLDLLEWTEVEDMFHFNIPKILICLERAKKPKASSGFDTHTDIDKEEEIDKEIEEEEDSDEPNGDRLTPLQLQTIWNNECGTLPKSIKLTEKRRKKCKSRIKEHPEPEFWIQIAQRIAVSDFCNNRAIGSQGWLADFDWFIAPETATRVLEKRYDNRAPQRETNREDDIERTVREMDEARRRREERMRG